MNRKLAMLEEVFEMEQGKLQEDMLLEDLSEYNSLAKMSLVVLFQDEFGKKISSKEISKFVTVKDILDAMTE